MAKGSRGGKRGATGGKSGPGSVKSVKGTDGKTIDLSISPLVYGAKDASLSGAARTEIEKYEAAHYADSNESSLFIDANGGIIEQNTGTNKSVGASNYARMTADVMTHVHPRTGGLIGGTFSTGDMKNFANYNQTTYRATAAEGTYSISKLKGFNATGFKRYVTQIHKAVSAEYSQDTAPIKRAYQDVSNAYLKGEKTWSDVMKAETQARAEDLKYQNKYLVSLHNYMLAGQSKYGYSYTLERR